MHSVDSDAPIEVALSADEPANQQRFGCTVADSIVAVYETVAAAKGVPVVVSVHDVGAVAAERTAQLCGALVDADVNLIRLRDVSDEVALRAALVHARIAERMVVIE